MPAITIRDVPEVTVSALKAKAARAGKSLQAYLLDVVSRDAATPTLAEMMDRLDQETRADVETVDTLPVITQ